MILSSTSPAFHLANILTKRSTQNSLS